MMSKGPDKRKFSRLRQLGVMTGQAAVEYVLIITLIVMGLAVVLSVTGPAVGNVFSNTVANLLNLTTTPEDPMSEAEFWNLVTAVASYTPDTIALITNTPAPAGDTDNDGVANEDDNCPNHYNPDQTDENPANGIGDICDINSSDYNVDDDDDGIIDNVDNCPGVPNPGQEDADGDGTGDACEPPPPPNTNTPGPSPTPADKEFPYPYQDTNQDDDWEEDFSTLLKGPWDTEYWTRGNAGCIADTFLLDAPAQVTTEESKIVFPRASHPYWTGLGSSPDPSIGTDFCARFTQTYRLEAGSYTWKLLIDPRNSDSSRGDRIRVTVGSEVVYVDWDGVTADQDSNLDTAEYVQVPWTLASTGEYEVKVEYADRTSRARLEVYLLDNGLQDFGECDWQSKTVDYAGGGTTLTITANGQKFWTDSPVTGSNSNGYYQPGSFCILRLRGTINLALAQYPFVEWYDQFSINNSPDTFWFAVREVGQPDWMLREIHSGKSESLGSWTNQQVNLAFFDGVDSQKNTLPTQNFVGKKIELGFVVEDYDDGQLRYGWFIDKFQVHEQTFNQYTFPFADDFEGTVNWSSDGDWGIVAPPYTHSGSKAWANNPNGNYANNINQSLTLDGLLDMSNTGTVTEPELVFWHGWDVETNDKLYVEISTDLGSSWQPLRTDPNDTTDYLINGSSENLAYKLERIPLDMNQNGINQDFRGKKVIVRFRLQTNSSGTGAGWYIDDVQFRNRPVTAVIIPDWCDNLNDNNSLGNWLIEGSWGLEAATPGKAAVSVPLAFSDSPVTASNTSGNYSDNTNATLYLDRIVDVASLSNPIMEFWHRWELGSNDWLIVEISNDNGITWTKAWDFFYTDVPDGYDSSVVQGDSWKEQISWKREVIFLNDWVTSGNKQFKVRFRLDAMNGSGNDDGWHIDNVCFKQYAEGVITLPWEDGFENGNANWYRGGEWELDGSTPRTGASAIVDSKLGNGNPRSGSSQDGQYQEESDSVLELRGIVDLTAMNATNNEPTLYYWERYSVATYDRMYAEVRTVSAQGVPTTNWIPVEVVNSDLTNVAYNRRQVNLTAYVGKYIQIRFRVQVLNTSYEADGWYLDNVRLVDRKAEDPVYPLPFNQGTADFGATGWVREGDWSILPDSRPLGSGSVLGPGQWQVDYYQKPDSPSIPPGFPAGTTNYEFIGTENVPEIDFNWGSSAPAIVLADHNGWGERWMTSYKRTVNFPEETTFSIFLYSDDGHRIVIDGGNAAGDSQWVPCGSCQTGQNPTNGSGTPFLYTFAPGAHFIEVQHFENYGGARLTVNFTLVSGGATGGGEDPFGDNGVWTTTYHKYCDGAIDEPAWNATSPASVSAIDFDWGNTGAPSVVLANNVDPGTTVTPPGPSGTTLQCATDDFNDNSLAASWTHTNIGDASSGGVSETSGGLQVTGRGSGYWGTDNMRFAYQSTQGNFRIEMDIVSFPLDNGGSNRKGGLTVREGTSNTSKRVMVNYQPGLGTLQFGYRSANGSTTSTRFAPDVTVSLPVRVAIQRVGSNFTAYYSTDNGATWIQPNGSEGNGTTTVSMNNTVLVGAAVSSYATGTSFTGRFDNFSLCIEVASEAPYDADGSGNVSIPAERPHYAIDALSRSWTVVNTLANSFNGYAMQSLPDSGTSAGDSTTGPEMRYLVNFPATLTYPMTYYFFARAQSGISGGSSDSFHVGLDSGTPVTYGGTGVTGFGSSWQWVNQFNGQSIRLTIPSAGVHTLNIWMREDGAALDHFYLSPNSNPTLPNLTTAATCYTAPNEYWAARFERTISVADELPVTFVITANDGHRLYTRPLGGSTWTLITDKWTAGNTNSSTTLVFQPGSTQVRIEYAAQSGADGNKIRLDYVLEGPVFHSDNTKGGNYLTNYGASLMLEGEVELPTGSNATLSWWERYDIGNLDSIIVEVNTIGGADAAPGAPSSWKRIYEQTDNTNSNWRKRLVDLTPYAGQRIVIRFRLDGLNTDEVKDGWYVDDITIVD